jgi:hypothetical protein
MDRDDGAADPLRHNQPMQWTEPAGKLLVSESRPGAGSATDRPHVMPPSKLDYETPPDPAEKRKRFVRRMAKWFVALYFVEVAAFASLNIFIIHKPSLWPEVFYGPALNLGSIFLILYGVIWYSGRRGPEA